VQPFAEVRERVGVGERVGVEALATDSGSEVSSTSSPAASAIEFLDEVLAR